MIDGGASETVAIADINRDGRPDIVSGEFWYEAPAWTPHRFRELNFTSNYLDGFSDLAIDVDADGYPDLVSVTWFAKKISWFEEPGQEPAEPGPKRRSTAGSRWSSRCWSISTMTARRRSCCRSPARPARRWRGTRSRPARGSSMSSARKATVTASAPETSTRTAAPTSSRPAAGSKRRRIRAAADGRSTPIGRASTSRRRPRGRPRLRPRPRRSPISGSCTSPTSTATAATTSSPARRTTTACSGSSRARAASGRGARSTAAWSQAHASTLVDLNGDGQPELVTGKRFMAHNGSDPGEREPLGVYWFESARRAARAAASSGSVTSSTSAAGWAAACRSRSSTSTATATSTSICAGKSGLFIAENLSKSAARK